LPGEASSCVGLLVQFTDMGRELYFRKFTLILISLKFLCELSAEIYLSEKIIIQHFKRPIFDKRLVIESA